MLRPVVLGYVRLKLVSHAAPAVLRPHNLVSNAIVRHDRADFLDQWSPDDGDVGPLSQNVDIKTTNLADVKGRALRVLCRTRYNQSTNATPV